MSYVVGLVTASPGTSYYIIESLFDNDLSPDGKKLTFQYAVLHSRADSCQESAAYLFSMDGSVPVLHFGPQDCSQILVKFHYKGSYVTKNEPIPLEV